MSNASPIVDSRSIAFSLLESGQKKTLTLDRAIETAAARLEALSPQDRGLCNAMVFGVLRHRGRLDHIIRACSDRAFDRIDPKVLTLLRLGIFQLVFLDRVPDFAAIHETMELSKRVLGNRGGRQASGFINAVLRKAATDHPAIALPDKKKNFTAWLGAACSIPAWLGKRWAKSYGRPAAEQLGRASLEIPPITLRINPLAVTRDHLIQALEKEGVDARPTPYSPLGIQITGPGKPIPALPGFDRGWFQVQDEAAQLVTSLLNPRPGERVLDACAGLGTKTCHMGQLMENSGQLVANDPDAGKQAGLLAEAGRQNISNIRPVSFDMTRARLDDLGGYFERILVDAPCTGLGVIRRNPDTRWKRSKADIQRMAALQKKILNSAANLVAPGGVLVYAVCSCEAEENQGVIDHFLDKRKDFSPDPGGFSTRLPWFAADETHPEEKHPFYFKTFPDHTGMDGFFTARLRRHAK